MTYMLRDINDYTEQYLQLPFEPIQATYRRQLVLSRIAHHRPRRLLEIGCGSRPLFIDLPDTAAMVIEPSPRFAANARQLALGRGDVSIVEGYVEDLRVEADETTRFDMIVLSCLLHEVADPRALLAAVHRQCTRETVVHVNVPNAESLHRLLAVAMGLIGAPEETSDMQRRMQQRGVYDQATLTEELTRAGFVVDQQGGLFIKPFTHAQMQELVGGGFMNPAMLDGLAKLAETMPRLASEIWVDSTASSGVSRV